jgi:hypothetical protein
MDPHTQGIKRVEIIRMYPKGTAPNSLILLIASVYGRWALAD